MKTRSKIFCLLFSFGVVAFYFIFVELYMPDMRPEPLPDDEVFDVGATSTEDFVAFGERIFTGKGSCRLCHKSIGGRAPELVDIVFIAEGRIKEAGYKGRALTSAGYIFESMLEPGAYVVSGYGKTQDGKFVSPMPMVTAAPINLSALEVRAVAAYLLRLSGEEVVVKPSFEMPTFGSGRARVEVEQ